MYTYIYIYIYILYIYITYTHTHTHIHTSLLDSTMFVTLHNCDYITEPGAYAMGIKGRPFFFFFFSLSLILAKCFNRWGEIRGDFFFFFLIVRGDHIRRDYYFFFFPHPFPNSQ